MLTVVKYIQEAPDGNIKCWYIDILKFRILIALSAASWYTKGVKRRIPIWISRKGIFIYKLAIRAGKRTSLKSGD
ncbi:hypothetical protein OCB09_09700 [Bacillus cereus]|uniref:hypothetical protein n=1 Tax=Bacillus cereus group TaxID=86661 RepID=UPI0018F50A4D|nr:MULTISPECIES: hypothetical protein [Bacillus cereus group]MBJ7935576.1 hypothetical protein [Bacillus cereus]MCU5503629.1 hypothetical protein [Bacillus cereus]MDR5047884.1 hypothetical protein [Bacillus thuringiensis]